MACCKIWDAELSAVFPVIVTVFEPPAPGTVIVIGLPKAVDVPLLFVTTTILIGPLPPTPT